jgi:ankyrin repeat protein
MKNLIGSLFLMAGLILACATPPESEGEGKAAGAGASPAAGRTGAGGWRCPCDIEERKLVEARISVYDKYDGIIPEIVEDLRQCAPRVHVPGEELESFAQIVSEYGNELEIGGWEDMAGATVANEKYWQAVLTLTANDITALLFRLLLLMREGMLARAALVSYFCYLDHNAAWERDSRIGQTVERYLQSITADSNRLVQKGIREWDKLNYSRALDLYRQALAVYPKNPSALYEIALDKTFKSITGMPETTGDQPAVFTAAEPYYSLIRLLDPLFQLAYQGTMTPELRLAALALSEKVLPSYEKLMKGGDILCHMKTMADGFYAMGEYELALYAYKYLLFHFEGEEYVFDRQVVENLCACLQGLHMEQLVPFLHELIAVLEKGAAQPEQQYAEDPATAAFLLAAGEGDTATVERLLREGADVNAVGNYGTTPLMWAAFGNCADVVRILLEAGADVNASGDQGWTALGMAVRPTVSAEIIWLLLKAGADLEARVECEAQECGRLDIHAGTPLLQACMNDCDPAVIRLLVEAGPALEARDEYGYTPLMWAAVTTRNAETLRILIEAGADVESRDLEGRRPLFSAAILHGDYEIYRLLLEAGADPNARGDRDWTALTAAAALHSNPGLIRLLLEAGADVNVRDVEDLTALMYAARLTKDPAVVALLLAAGADPKLRDDNGKTAFDYAEENPSLKGTLELQMLAESVFE